MASPKAFFDSNLLVYTDDPRFPKKLAIASGLIEKHLQDRTGAISIQVLQEYYSVTTGKLKTDPSVAREKARIFSSLTVFRPAVEDVLAAIDLHRLHQLSFWDALIVRAAMQSGARILYAEDMQNGRRFDGIQIVNPFV
jgi:predicted nucleic acid-binding protein